MSIIIKEKDYILYNDDCLTVLENKIDKETIDFIITDPPYGVNSNDLYDTGYKDNFYNVREIARLFYKVLKNNSRCFIFSAQKTLLKVITEFERQGFKLHQILVWYRPNLIGGTKKKTFDFTSVHEFILNFHKGKPMKIKKSNKYNNFDVLKYSAPQSNYKKDKRYHLHQKPLELIKHIIEVCTNENDLILDPFAGSGTTLIACKLLKRKCIAIEINKYFCNICIERLKQINMEV